MSAPTVTPEVGRHPMKFLPETPKVPIRRVDTLSMS